jgi:hypothetical protein
VVVFVDDAQFARDGGDERTLKLLVDLWYRARAQGWPLLLVASHWAVEWTLDQAHPDQSFAGTFARLMTVADRHWQPVQLGKEPSLSSLVESGLSGLPAADRALLLDKLDPGWPQLRIYVFHSRHGFCSVASAPSSSVCQGSGSGRRARERG